MPSQIRRCWLLGRWVWGKPAAASDARSGRTGYTATATGQRARATGLVADDCWTIVAFLFTRQALVTPRPSLLSPPLPSPPPLPWRSTATMATDIATLSQLLQASLDPHQNKQGTSLDSISLSLYPPPSTSLSFSLILRIA